MEDGPGWFASAERARELLSPVVALLSSTLLLCCLVTLPQVAIGWPALRTADARLPGWTGVALILALTTAALSLLSCPRLGSAPSLALGTTSALLGLALAGDVSSDAQAVLVLFLFAIGVGALFAFGLCLLDELPADLARVAVVGWVLPLAGGWGAVGWLALHGRTPAEARLGLHPPAIALGALAVLLLVWAVVTLLVEPPRVEASRRTDSYRSGWENAWAALAVLVVGTGSVVMLIGFQPHLSPSWTRPVVLLFAALVATGLALCGAAIPEVAARPAYLAVVVSAATGPACIHALLMVSARAAGPLSVWVLLAMTAAGVLGVWLGWWWPRVGVTFGLVLVAAAAVGGWVMPANEWVMSAAAAPMVVGVAMTIAAGLRIAATDRMWLRFVALAGLTALLLGEIAAAPIAWSLGAKLTGPADLQAGGRVLLGLTFALCVVSAAVCAVLLPALDSAGDVTGVPAEDARKSPTGRGV